MQEMHDTEYVKLLEMLLLRALEILGEFNLQEMIECTMKEEENQV